MAYLEITRTDARTPVPERTAAVDSGSKKTAFAFDIHPQPRVLPAIRFADEKERAMTLQDFRGKFVLLNLWATWCPPCRAEMPTLDRLQAKLGGPDFEVAALSIDRGGPFVVRSFYNEIEIKALRIYIDQSGAAASALGVNGIPATLLIDRAGRELGRKMGPAEWDSPEVVKLIQGYLGAAAPDQPGKH
ncbi:MAG: TlpA family protein disulfide reductase [Betaproteobacteria bacterium]|nr:TlpA family protein disulfide reductase [Betaproteobacteria bacterium]